MASTDLNSVIYFALIIGAFALAVWGGFKIIARADLGRIAQVIFGVICLLIIVFFLLYLANGNTSLHR